MHKTLLDLVLPPRCVVSGEIVSAQGMSAPHVWRGLDFISAPFCQRCGEPFAYEIEGALTCAECLDTPPPYQAARSALAYNDTAKDLLLSFKHGDQIHAVRSFIPWLMQSGAPLLAHADLLIPVPLHYWRLVKRRYNQAALIADVLGKEAGLPVRKLVLQRTRPTPSQGHLSRADRAANVKGAFTVPINKVPYIKDKHVILVDDVMTTGATLAQCATVLLRSGARRVDCLTVARALKHT